MMAMAECTDCNGYGHEVDACGARCESCAGLGVRLVDVDEDVFLGDIPARWTKEHAKALLSRIRTGSPVVMPEVVWSPYPDGRP